METINIQPAKNTDHLLKIEQVLKILAISRATFYKCINDGILPKPIKLGTASRWRNSDIQNYINSFKPAQ